MTDGLPSGWAPCTIDEIIRRDVVQRAPRGDGAFLYIDISSIDNRSKRIVDPKRIPKNEAPTRARQLVREGDVIVSMTRPNLNAVALVPSVNGDAVASTGFCVLRAVAIEPKWLFYLVQTDAFVRVMTARVQGVMYPAVRPKDVLSYSLPLAPAAEQQRIVAEIEKHLTRLDAAVAALKAAQAKLKRYRAAVLKAAVEGRLVPTEAALARADERDYEPADVLLGRILRERRARWEAAELEKMRVKGREPKDDRWKAAYKEPEPPNTEQLPELPEGWAWASTAQVGEVKGGIQKQPKRRPAENHYPYLRVANVLRGRLDLTELHRMELFGNELEQLRLEAGDLLVVEGNGSPGEIGRMAIWRGAVEDCVHQNHIIRVRPLDVIPDYILAYWNSPAGSQLVMSVASSTSGLHTLSVAKVGKIVIPLPPEHEQGRIVVEIDRRMAVFTALETAIDHSLKRAARLRQSILRLAFEGRLVPQGPNDEPASALLDRIRAERARIPSANGRRPRRSRAAEAAAAQMRLDEVAR